MTNRSNTGPRFTVSSDGRIVYDGNFHYDAKLTLDGDFGTDAERIAYAQAVAAALNKAQIHNGRMNGAIEGVE